MSCGFHRDGSRVRNGCTENRKLRCAFYAGYHSILNEHGGDTATAEAFSGMTVDTTTAAPARKKKLPFYIAPENLMRWN